MKKSNAELINQSSGNVEWLTPTEILEAARQTLGEIDLDPASTPKANERVKAHRIYTAQDDGLQLPWRGNIWLNWPFSRKTNYLWVRKLLAECEACRVNAACCICFSSTSERRFQPLLAFPQCFLHRGTNYLLPDGRIARAVPWSLTWVTIQTFSRDLRRLGHYQRRFNAARERRLRGD
jgi:ParB family chromosome partitioning protein